MSGALDAAHSLIASSPAWPWRWQPCWKASRTRLLTIYVVGASDGKFVLPLARRGIQVRAIERDRLTLDGGPITLPGSIAGTMAGLRRRLATEGLTDRVKIIEADLLDLTEGLDPADAVWTSCSWHYSINHRRPLADFLTVMQSLCRPDGGVLGAEYMRPVHPRQAAEGHGTAEHRDRLLSGLSGQVIESEPATD